MNRKLLKEIPVIDLFAGPGGLAEGFFSFRDENVQAFRIALSIEKDPFAHRTLELRSFFRQFPHGEVPEEYYWYLRGKISRAELFDAYPKEAKAAGKEAWHAELGSEKFPDDIVHERIKKARGDSEKWILIGGPPCQAYSTVGRSRNKGEKDYVPEDDKRHFLYREYLKIIARHWPPVFVMENVKGILSAKVNGDRIFDRILADLHEPRAALMDAAGHVAENGYSYKIYSLTQPVSYPASDFQPRSTPADFLIMSEKYGIPQARHRVILIGVREDYDIAAPMPLTQREGKPVSAASVLDDLPKLRSGLSREEDTFEIWKDRVAIIADRPLFDEVYDEQQKEVWDRIGLALLEINAGKRYGRGEEFIPFATDPDNDRWYHDPRLKGVCNHTTKAHMTGDLHRYLFASCFANFHERSPTLPEFPKKLWPAHKNAHLAKRSGNFSDRFRVQLASKPATTVMSHISKDGHYYIHYDPAQCRSLTVREAARLQTFPDNYFFEGTRTQQYTQVGNAVPPLLAFQIAEVIYDLFT